MGCSPSRSNRTTDYTEWTIKIRDGVMFTDGSPVNAAAVIYNLQATGTGALISATLKDLAKVPHPDDPDRMVLKIEQLDELTFVIYTGDDGDPQRPLPWRNFPHTLTGQWGLIASPFWLAEVGESPELATQPVGSGPFVVDSYEPRSSLEVSRNPDYWMTDAAGNQLPYLDSMSFRVIEDSEIAVEALERGDLDVVTTSNGRAIGRAQQLGDEFTVTVQDEHVDTGYLLIDLDKPGPLQDRRVRCALSLAIDRDEFNDVTNGGFNAAANGLFSPGQQGYLEDNGLPLEQDLDAAAAAIADYEEETGEDVEFTLGHIIANVVVQGAELLIGWWSEIGVDVDDVTIPQNDFINQAVLGVPEFRGLLVAPAQRGLGRSAVPLVALRECVPRWSAVAQLRPAARPRHRRRPRCRAAVDVRRGSNRRGRGHQPGVRRTVLLHPAQLDPVGCAHHGVRRRPRNVGPARRHDRRGWCPRRRVLDTDTARGRRLIRRDDHRRLTDEGRCATSSNA